MARTRLARTSWTTQTAPQSLTGTPPVQRWVGWAIGQRKHAEEAGFYGNLLNGDPSNFALTHGCVLVQGPQTYEDLLDGARRGTLPEVVVPDRVVGQRVALDRPSTVRAFRGANLVSRDVKDTHSHEANDTLIAVAGVGWWVASAGRMLAIDTQTTSKFAGRKSVLRFIHKPKYRPSQKYPAEKSMWGYSDWLLAFHEVLGNAAHFWLLHVDFSKGSMTVYDSVYTSPHPSDVHNKGVLLVQRTIDAEKAAASSRLGSSGRLQQPGCPSSSSAFKLVMGKAPQQPVGSNLCGYYVAEFGRRLASGAAVEGQVDVRETVEWLLKMMVGFKQVPLALMGC